ncbi:MAG: L-threonylcarbamoyladenylate synthase [Abditibacteriota bacterium]|nr:L-threonylcarbamoyladenylate synthase [Abditibacteriota bacterium]
MKNTHLVAATPATIARAAQILRDGGLVAFPTETVYGLGANALDESAVAKIFAAKERPSFNPLIVHVADIEAAHNVLLAWPERAQALAKAFWPGPLTLVLPKAAHVPARVTAGLPTVAVRAPAHPIAQAMLQAAGIPIAAPSANLFTQISPTQAEHVWKSLGERADLILDGGASPVGIESTVLSLAEASPILLRPGTISRAQIEAVIGPIEVLSQTRTDEAPRLSPGMLERHYAPRAETRRFAAHQQNHAQRLAAQFMARGQRIGVLYQSTLIAGTQHPIKMPDRPDEYAQQLYAALHTLEDTGCDLILIEAVPDDAAWSSVHDRLQRASQALDVA